MNGKISDERFVELSADYEAEQAELKKRAVVLQAELDKSQVATVNARNSWALSAGTLPSKN